MTHETPDRLIAYLDGELPERERAEVAAHLSGCTDCAAQADRLRAATRELSRALARADVAPPPRAPATRSRRRRPRRILAEAAVLVLVLGGVAAAAIPGSPVREWIARALAGPDRAGSGGVAEQAAEGTAGRESPGVSVSIAAGRVLVLLTDAAPETRVRVRLVDGDRVRVRADARFRTGRGTIEVVGAGPGDVVIDLPRAADSATIRVDGRTALIKEGADLRILAPSVDSAGAEVSFRVGSG